MDLGADAPAMATTLMVAPGSSLFGLAPGDQILLIQITGNGAGANECATVKSVNQAQELISLTGKLLHAYSASGGAVTEGSGIPQSATPPVPNGGVVTPNPGTAATGGVFAST